MNLSATGAVSLSSLFRNLRIKRTSDGVSLQKLSTDLWTADSAAVKPSPYMRAYLGRVGKELEKFQQAKSTLQTSQGGLERINDVLLRMRAQLLEFLSNPTADRKWVNTLQAMIAEEVDEISNIVKETKFKRIPLLDGTQAFKLKDMPAALVEANITRALIPTIPPAENKEAGVLEVVVSVTSPASKAVVSGTIPALQSEAATIRVMGPLGEAILEIAGGAAREDIEAAINARSRTTGVEARKGAIQSVVYGPTAFSSVEFLSGRLEGVQPGLYVGKAIEALVAGKAATSVPNEQALAASTTSIAEPLSRAVVYGTIASAQSAASRVRIKGSRGEVTIDVPAGASRRRVEEMINSWWQSTGVIADEGVIKSIEAGGKQFIEIEFKQGVLEGIVPGSYYRGSDTSIGIDGETASVAAHTVAFEADSVSGMIAFRVGTGKGEYPFKVEGGLTMERKEDGKAKDELRFGIADLSPAKLGAPGGYGSVESIISVANTVAVNPTAALRVVDQALVDIGRLKGNMASMGKEVEKKEFKSLKLVNGELVKKRVAPLEELAPDVLAQLARKYILQSPMMTILGGTDLEAESVSELLL